MSSYQLSLVGPDGQRLAPLLGFPGSALDRVDVPPLARFEIGVPPGSWTLRLVYPNGRRAEIPVTVAIDVATVVELP